MKIIVSTKVFANTIKEVLVSDFTEVIISKKDKKLTFKKLNGFLYKEVEFLEDEFSDSDIKIAIDYNQWFRMSHFLNQLPEQPIIIDFCDYGNDNLHITLSGFVQIFSS